MTDNETEHAGLTDAVKASVVNAGLVTQIKQAVLGHKPVPDTGMQALRKDAQAMAESLQQLLDGGGLDDATSQKIQVMLSRLRSALQGGNISREALASALSEAASMMSAADSSGKSAGSSTIERLWQKIDAYNKGIDDDFGKMRQAGIVFDEKLWEEHKRLSEYLHENPHDIQEQKALDAVDDQLLNQAEAQIGGHPDVKKNFDDAKKKSDDRHQVVDQAMQAVKKQDAAANLENDTDWGTPAKPQAGTNIVKDVTINDIEPPPATAPPEKNSSKTFVRKQTNECWRTKSRNSPAFSPFRQNRKRLVGTAFRISYAPNQIELNSKSVQRYTLVCFITDLPGAAAFQPLRKTTL